jgi:predicted N-formylglutamate amidohydrolase
VIERYYLPHRNEVEREIARHVRTGRRVLHVGVHTFTPVWKGKEREVDVGVLFDPARASERAVGDAWIAAMKRLAPALRIRRNLPYRGTSDGFTTDLRRRFPAARYAGIEIELNNAIAGGSMGQAARRFAAETIARGLQLAIGRAIGRAPHAHRGGVAGR